MSELLDDLVWVSLHSVIRREFGFSDEEDFAAAEILDLVMQGFNRTRIEVLRDLKKSVEGSKVLVVGAGPSCERVSEFASSYDVVVAADGALRCCRRASVEPQVLVTDLDGVSLSDLMSFDGFIVVHAHGDNVSKLTSWVPLLRGKKVLGTSQVSLTTSNVSFSGGFTDGDRAVYLALENGATEVGLIGFDFGEVVGRYSKPNLREEIPANPVKKRKLYWCKILIDLMRLNRGWRIGYLA
ncbi:MAG: 6-hydroxymethylpterin diphosphokinase MptE-like protein [Thermoprotei archaeon]